MFAQSGITLESEFIWRRLEEQFPPLFLLLPIFFALAVWFLIVFSRQEKPMSELLKTFFIPPMVFHIFTILFAIGLLSFVIGTITLGFLGIYFDTWQYAASVAPLFIYVLIIGFLATIAIFIHKPESLVSFVIVLAVSGAVAGIGYILQDFDVGGGKRLGWLVILFPILIVALIYVGIMYAKDSKTVHPLWAAFLGFLRCLVYLILAIVFLLPGCQSFETRKTYSKVLVLFDVSGSMDEEEPLDAEGKKMVSRRKKVLNFLTAANQAGKDSGTFMSRIMDKSPVGVYRFGGVLDVAEAKQFLEDNPDATKEEWQNFLNPKLKLKELREGEIRSEEEKKKILTYESLRSRTNCSGAVLQALRGESNHNIQAVIVISDGQSNLGSPENLSDIEMLASKPGRPIHIITVGVGKFREEKSIRVEAIQAPQQARPDDEFKVRVPVFGDGLIDREFTVYLDITRVRKDKAKNEWIQDPPGFKKTLEARGKFKGSGKHPHDEVEFIINTRKLAGYDPKDESKDDKLEGYWQFTARVPRLPEETTPQAVHSPKRPTQVLVQKRKLRVLLFAGGPTREYQFLRTLLYREVLENRAELTVYLQNAATENVHQDVEAKRLLTHFPNTLGKDNPGDLYSSLTNYDVIVAFDPNWKELKLEQLKLLKKWVGGPTAGGLIYVGGPIYSYQLARPGGVDLSPIQIILPVKMESNPLIVMGINHDNTRPYTLNFTSYSKQYDFLKLSESDDKHLEGWKEFFWDGEEPPSPGKQAIPYQGFYTYTPVKKIQPNARTLATFAGPLNSRINNGRDEQPYLVVQNYGAGKTAYIGSGEMWRMRQYDEEYHQRFWVKLIRWVASGNLSRQSNYGQILMAPRAGVGPVPIEAQVLGENMKVLSPDTRPVVEVVRRGGFGAKPDENTPKEFRLEARNRRSKDFNGWFSGSFKVYSPGDYTLRIPIEGTGEYLSHDITIYRPDPELDNKRPDFGHLYQIATAADSFESYLSKKDWQELTAVLKIPVREKIDEDEKQPQPKEKDKVAKDQESYRLFFPIEEAHRIPKLLKKIDPDEDSVKGALKDLWDMGWDQESVSLYWVLLSTFALVSVLTTIILIFGIISQEWVQTIIASLILALMVIGIVTLLIMNGVIVSQGMQWVQVPLQASGFTLLLWVPTIIGLIICSILLTIRQYVFSLILFVVIGLFAAGVLLVDLFFEPPWAMFPLQMSYILLVIVTLLSIEWLTRKMLRLA